MRWTVMAGWRDGRTRCGSDSQERPERGVMPLAWLGLAWLAVAPVAVVAFVLQVRAWCFSVVCCILFLVCTTMSSYGHRCDRYTLYNMLFTVCLQSH